jgi:ubiquinone/menaquinone biosynthesis C-methylase UbiE
MGFYQRHVVPCLTHLAMRNRLLLEIGLGSGLNLPFYRPPVDVVIGLEPSAELRRMARARAASAAVPVELLGASAEALPLDDRSVDTVVTTWTLCTIPDAPRALAEMRRVLRPGGSLLFVEHGRAPEPGVARWQDRLDPLWERLAGGCHLNRKMDALIAGNGLRIVALKTARIPGPPTHTFFYEGRATPDR